MGFAKEEKKLEINHGNNYANNYENNHDTNETDMDVISAYISQFPENVQVKLNEMRALIRSLAPEAIETFSYQMPTFNLEGNLVHFAGYKNHIGFYPAPSGISIYEDEIKKFKYAKGSVQFPIESALPVDLITRIVKFRVEENLSKARKKVK